MSVSQSLVLNNSQISAQPTFATLPKDYEQRLSVHLDRTEEEDEERHCDQAKLNVITLPLTRNESFRKGT